MSGVLSLSLRRGWCGENPLARVDVPSFREQVIAVLNPEEIKCLRNAAESPEFRDCAPAVWIMMYAGIRPGEVARLRWCDVDMENGIISVNHTLVYYNHRDEKGCYFSINAGMLGKERHASMVQAIPLDRMLTETDGPFTLAGDRPSQPTDVAGVVEQLGGLHGLSASDMARIIRTNLRMLLGASAQESP